MDMTELHIFITNAGFYGFLGIIAWAFSSKRRGDFEEAAMLPFTEPEELAMQRKALLLGR